MFYDNVGLTEHVDAEAWAIVALTPSESKRLIGKAVATLEEIKKALKSGRMIISEGTTNAYVIEELFGTPISKEIFACGTVCEGGLSSVPTEVRIMPYLLKCGEPLDARPPEAADDVNRTRRDRPTSHAGAGIDIDGPYVPLTILEGMGTSPGQAGVVEEHALDLDEFPLVGFANLGNGHDVGIHRVTTTVDRPSHERIRPGNRVVSQLEQTVVKVHIGRHRNVVPGHHTYRAEIK